MDVRLIERINELWRPIYPFLGRWIFGLCSGGVLRVAELGPFSGGISSSLLKDNPELVGTCLVEREDHVKPVRAVCHEKVLFTVGSLVRLPFQPCLDLIISRGAFFFLTTEIIKETYRSLAPSGCALLGGGYGPLTPVEHIAKIAKESKELNYRLGKRLISRHELITMIDSEGLRRDSDIIDEGGLWVLIRKRNEDA